jgi:hypothetical protein
MLSQGADCLPPSRFASGTVLADKRTNRRVGSLKVIDHVANRVLLELDKEGFSWLNALGLWLL